MKSALPLILVSIFVARTPAQGSKSAQQTTGTEAHTQSGSASSALTPSQIFSRASASVVVIVADDQSTQREALGSGFLVSRDRIATNHHVLEGMKEAYVVFSDGKVKPVSGVVADSVQQDLIILRVETGNRPSLSFGDELSLQQGDPVYALGAPKGLELSFTNGIVSSFRKSNAQFLIQTTAAIAPGSSGGPLFDRTGRVVGVTTSMISDAPGIYFSVGVGDVKRLLRTPQPVLLPLDEWAKQQAGGHASEAPDFVGPNGAQNRQGAPSSLEETLGWLEKFSAVHGHWILGDTVKVTQTNLVTAFPSQGCSIGVVHKTDDVTTNFIDINDVIDLHKINPEAITARSAFPPDVKPDEYAVFIKTSSSSYKIKRTVVWENGNTNDTWQDGIYIVFDLEENAERFANALKHAVTLCGGATSPF